MQQSPAKPKKPTSRLITIKNHPIRFLLYLEWILLLIVALTEVLPRSLKWMPQLSPLNLFCVALLGLLGLRLPATGWLDKLVYTLVEIGLILLAAIAGGIHLFPVLYVILVIRSCLIFEQWGRATIMGLSFTLFLVTLSYRVQNFTFPIRPRVNQRFEFILFSFVLFFGLILIFLFLLVNAILLERKSRKELASANEQLRQYASQVEEIATLKERTRIARDIHDSLGHSLTGLNLQLEASLKLWQSNPDKAYTFLEQAKKLGSKALREVRQSVSKMRADPLQGKTFQDAIASLVNNFQRTTGIAPICDIYLFNSISTEMKICVYRLIQESLTNVCKHAKATHVTIQLMTTTSDLYLLVEDNGIGFNLKRNSTGFGLQGMRDRVLELGGQLEIKSSPNNGCKITATFPLTGLTQPI